MGRISKEEAVFLSKETATALLEEHECELEESLGKALDTLLSNYLVMRELETKKPAKMLVISFLYSHVLLQKPWLRIDLYDGKGFADPVECYVLWDIHCISVRIYRNIPLFVPAWQGEKIADYWQDYEVEAFWQKQAALLFGALERFLIRFLSKAKCHKQLPDCWYYGEYMGNVQVLKREETT